MRTTLQSCVTKHIYICSLQVCTPGRGTRKSHAIQPAPLPRERSEPIMNEIAEKGTEGGEKNANTELSATGMRSADSEKRDCNNGAVRNAGKGRYREGENRGPLT